MTDAGAGPSTKVIPAPMDKWKGVQMPIDRVLEPAAALTPDLADSEAWIGAVDDDADMDALP